MVLTLPDAASATTASAHRGRSAGAVATLRYSWVLPFAVGLVVVAVAVAGIGWVGSAIGTALLLLFLAYFIRHLAFASAALASCPADLRAEPLPPLTAADLPTVSVLVACKNEAGVLDRLVPALLALDYPPGRIEWVLVDDGSTDDTPAILDRYAAAVADLHVVHRPATAGGGKSGALNDALRLASGEILVVFDADHHPRPDTVRRLVRHFAAPTVAAVQGRCTIANAGDSLLAELVAIDYAGGYLINEYGRQAVFGMPAYGGANCAVRASVLRSLGGWNPTSVTEDTDLTMRLVLAGHRVRYDVTAVDEEEGVVTLRRYWRQRYRWARGHQQCWRDYRSAVWRSPRLNLVEKIETTMFLFGFHLPAVASLGIVVMVLWGLGISAPAAANQLFVFTMLMFLGPLVELGGGLLLSGAERPRATQMVWFLPMFFAGMAVCTVAWIDGVLDRPYAWAKTMRRTDTDDGVVAATVAVGGGTAAGVWS